MEGVEAARPFYETALSIFIELNDSIKTAQLLNNMGAIALMSNAFEEARSHFKQAIAVYEQSPPDPFVYGRIVTALNNLALSHIRRHEFEAAHPYVERALALVNTHLAADSATRGWTLFTYGMVAYGRREFIAAQDSFHEAYQLHRAVYGKDKVTTARVMLNIGAIEYIFGNIDTAHRWLTQGLAIIDKQDRHNSSTGFGYLTLGKIQIAQGKFAAAVHSLNRANTVYQRHGLLLPSGAETRWLLAQFQPH